MIFPNSGKIKLIIFKRLQMQKMGEERQGKSENGNSSFPHCII